MNVGEWGSTINVATGFNMSGYTTLQLQFLMPGYVTKTVAATLGTTTFTDAAGNVFTANQYVLYKTLSGDINAAGTWQVKVLYTDAVQYLPSTYVAFTVGA